jgi:hypothetical protein
MAKKRNFIEVLRWKFPSCQIKPTLTGFDVVIPCYRPLFKRTYFFVAWSESLEMPTDVRIEQIMNDKFPGEFAIEQPSIKLSSSDPREELARLITKQIDENQPRKGLEGLIERFYAWW